MLHPYDRRLLSESLRPPENFSLDCAIGTTFSLDLYTLLTAPLAFTFFALAQEEGQEFADRMAMLTTMQTYADRISIFCQAGQIALPAQYQSLYPYLEDMIIEVNAQHPTGLFHPKIWLLRYTASDDSIFYRMLCLSRNLTTDRSWDTMLVLDGTLTDHTHDTNDPLCDFIATLPDLAVHSMSEQRQEYLDLMYEELPQVQFALPDGFDRLTFWAIGIDDTPSFPITGPVDRLLIMSPFVAGGMLKRLTRHGTGHVLISRLEELQKVNPDFFASFERIYVLQPDVDFETSTQVENPDFNENDTQHDGGDEQQDADKQPDRQGDTLVGLHAKLYVADSGNEARVWTGSANATVAAFEHNVEFLVELVGPIQKFGVDAVLQQTEETDLIDMLTELPFTEGDSGDSLVDEQQETTDHLAEETRNILARAALSANVVSDDSDRFFVQLMSAPDTSLNIPAGVSVYCWPITRAEATAATLATGESPLATFGPLSFEALTAFFAFTIVAINDDYKSILRFVLKVPLNNAPADRRDRVLRSLITNRDDFLRFLLFLLAGNRSDIERGIEFLMSGEEQETNQSPHKRRYHYHRGLPVFEDMVRALATSPDKLDQVAIVVQDLCKTPEGQQLLPDGFESLWQPIWAARERLQS